MCWRPLGEGLRPFPEWLQVRGFSQPKGTHFLGMMERKCAAWDVGLQGVSPWLSLYPPNGTSTAWDLCVSGPQKKPVRVPHSASRWQWLVGAQGVYPRKVWEEERSTSQPKWLQSTHLCTIRGPCEPTSHAESPSGALLGAGTIPSMQPSLLHCSLCTWLWNTEPQIQGATAWVPFSQESSMASWRVVSLPASSTGTLSSKRVGVREPHGTPTRAPAPLPRQQGSWLRTERNLESLILKQRISVPRSFLI